MDALAAAHDAAVQMIDTSIVRVHQHVATRYDKLAANSTKRHPACSFDNVVGGGN